MFPILRTWKRTQEDSKANEKRFEIPNQEARKSFKIWSVFNVNWTFIKSYIISGTVLSIQDKEWNKTWSRRGDRYVKSNCSTIIKGTPIEKCQSKEMRSFYPTFCYRDMLRVSKSIAALYNNFFLLFLSLLPLLSFSPIGIHCLSSPTNRILG